MEVLLSLADHQGNVLSKNELMDAVWKDVYVSEGAIRRTVSQLRSVLEDDAHAPQYIETIPKIGYRFVAPVSSLKEPVGLSSIPSDVSKANQTLFKKGILVFSFLLLAAIAMYWLTNQQPDAPLEFKSPQRIQVTSTYGDEIYPSLSPMESR